MLNTINLHEDDSLFVIEDLESYLEIKLADDEVTDLVTVGQLYDLLRAKLERYEGADTLWVLLVLLLREYSGCADEINRETTFLSEFAQKR